ncbi:MAG: LOG family protein [Phycisphaerae bacterium]|nr:LOG family protein [Phycisphaerae bacterium]MDW8262210.1 LOG family protein [Phycisphaerales bacterium]
MKEIDTVDNNIEQSQETAERPHPRSRADLSEIHAAANTLVEALRKVDDGDLVAELVANSIKLLRDDTNRGDIKLVNKSFKELRYALKVFAPYRDVRKVAIFGSARTPPDDPDYLAAAEFGRKMAALRWMVITGAGGGIMAAGHGGAGPEPSFGLAIRLPFEQKTNDYIAGNEKLINFKYFFTRKLMFLRSSHAVVLFPGGFGTMDEGFEVLTLVQTGKSVPMPIVMVDRPGGQFWHAWQDYVSTHLLGRKLISPEDFHLYRITDSVDEAIREVVGFYRNYHSVRYFRDDVILRLNRAPDAAQLDRIRREFSDLLLPGGSDFRVSGALPVEADETPLAHLPRLVFGFNKRDHGRMRLLINYLNTF